MGNCTTEHTESTEWLHDPLTERVIGCAIEVHRTLGPGLLESSYEKCLAHELMLAKCKFKLQVPMPIEYKRCKLDCGYRLDLLVEDRLVVELKAVDQILPIHQAQLLTYLKIAKLRVGLLLNFNTKILKDGVRRFSL